MAKLKLDSSRIRSENPGLYRRLLYEVARLFAGECKSHSEIAKDVYEWARTHAPCYYNPAGQDNLTTVWVGRRIAEARSHDYQFLTVGRFEEAELSRAIRARLPAADRTKLMLAPDTKSLLRQVWLDFDDILTQKVKSSSGDQRIVIGVGGGNTMLALTDEAHSIRTFLKWHKPGEIPDAKRKKVIVCSLTNGGSHNHIAALSDTVAANIAQVLHVDAHGLLGPALFSKKSELEAFKKNSEVQKHIRLATKADIILTSVGNVHDESSLTSKVLGTIDSNYLTELRKKRRHLGDILYNCFDGFSGEPIPFPARVKNRIFTVMACQELQEMVDAGRTTCMVVVKGQEKGYHALRGVIVKHMASDIYMDVECAKGLIEAISHAK